MMPLFLVENKHFQYWVHTIDNCFKFPTRKTLKTSYMQTLLTGVSTKHQLLLNNSEWINISVDAWSDGVMRSYNGYIAQFIDIDWKIYTIPFCFIPFNGNCCFLYETLFLVLK